MNQARILVVEDEAVVARDIALQLTMLGYAPVGHATRGEQAIALALELHPDLVLMDIQLGGAMDGIAAAEIVREKTMIPVVFLTAYASDDTLERAKKVHPYGYVLKPFSERELRTVLEMALYKCTAERQLQEAALHTQAILNNVADGVITINDQGVMETVNQAACAIFGYRLTEMLGKNVSMLMPQPDQDRHDGYLAHYRDTGEARVIGMARDVLGQRKDGSPFPMTLSLSRTQRAGRNIFIGSIRDNTQQQHYLQELDRHRHHLEELVDVRTAELTVARQQADAANQAKGTFVAHMSHEIRTPMNAILGFTHLLQSDEPTPAQRLSLGKIERAGQHMLAVINEVLDFTKLEANAVVLESMDFHLPSLLRDVLSLVSATAQDKGLRVEVLPGNAPDWLRGDPTRLRQALLNYVSNAVKFTDQGGVTVRVTCPAPQDSPSAEGALMVRFEVTDTGIGIAGEKLEQLFKPFEQANASTTRQYGGTGLGLAITSRLAHRMGGDAGLHSEPCVGSTFWFSACLLPGQAQAQSASLSVEESIQALRLRYPGALVLLVDDDPFNREVGMELLQAAGLRVDTAADGFDAVCQAQVTLYDLVFMDVQMPVVNGLEATQRIRALPGWGQVPILALTANAFAQDRQMCLEAGMNELLVKPINPKKLYAAILAWLSLSETTIAGNK